MARSDIPGRWATTACLALGAALLIAACGGAPGSVNPTDPPSTAPTATPTAVPTPSPTPIDVAAAFVKIATDPAFKAVGTIDGTVTIAGVKGEISGRGLFDSADSSGSTTLAVGTFKQVTHSVTVGGDSWTRREPGPWIAEARTGTAGKGLDDYLRSVSSIVDLGVVTRDGRQLHHLQPKDGNRVSPEVIGFEVGDDKDAMFTVDLYATDDGTPAIMTVTGSWTVMSGATPIPSELDFDMVLSDVGKPQVITPPDDVWVRYTSKTHGYSMAHPAAWTVKAGKDQDQYLVNDVAFVYVAMTPYTGSTAKFTKALKAVYSKDFGGDPVSETATGLDGKPATRLLYQFKNDADQDITFADDVLSLDGTGWEVFLVTVSDPGDIEMFDQFVSTFDFTE